MTKYDDALDAMDTDAERAAQAALSSAKQFQPDQYAQAIKRGQELNAPASIIARNPDAYAAPNKYEAFLDAADSPATTRWLTNPDNAAVAQDDVDNLRAIEKVARNGWIGAAGRSGVAEEFYDSAAHLLGPTGIRQTFEAGLVKSIAGIRAWQQRGLAEQEEALAEWRPDPKFAHQRAAGADERLRESIKEHIARGQAAREGLKAAEGVGQVASEVAQESIRPQAGFIERSVQQGVASGANALLATLVAGPEAGVATLGLQSFGSRYSDLSPLVSEGKLTEGDAVQSAAMLGTLEALTEYLPGKALVKNFPGFGKAVAEFAAAELPGEYVASLAQLLDDYRLQLRDDITVADVVETLKDTTGATLAGGATQVTAAQIIKRIAQATNARKEMGVSSGAAQDKQTAEELAAAAQASKLATRSPEKLEEHIAALKKDTGVENVYIEPQAFREFYQSDEAAAAAVAEMTGSVETYYEAALSDSRIAIPVEKYVARIATQPEAAKLVDHLSFSDTGQTAAEIEATREAFQARVKELAKQVDETVDSSQVVFDDMLAKLKAAGYEQDTAARYATLIQERFKTRAARLGVDAAELYAEKPITIERRGFNERPKFDINDDTLIDRVRSGNVPTEREALGESLVEFIKRKGGLKDDPELDARDAKKAIRGLVKQKGMSLDAAAELAAEAGYISAHDMTELLAALDKEISGKRVHLPGSVNEKLLATRMAAESMQEQLLAMGIDVKTASNEEIKRALARQYEQSGTGLSAGQVGQRTIAGTEPAAGWETATRILDKQGKPLKFHRGGNLAAQDFSDDRLGYATGHPSSGLGIFFTNSQDEAAEYGEVSSSYLDVRKPKVLKIEDVPSFESKEESIAFREEWKAKGFDGFVISARHLGGPTWVVAFDATQVIQDRATELFQSNAGSVGDALDALVGNDLEDDQVFSKSMPRGDDESLSYLTTIGDLYLSVKGDEISDYGPHELFFHNKDNDPVGLVRLTKSPNQVSINMIAIKEEYRGQGVGKEFYEYLLDDLGLSVKSDKEITDATAGVYRSLLRNHPGEVAPDGRVIIHPIPEQMKELFQPAYHGSPHRFDKFDLSKIGTGEGAQAYGWGQYFADKKDVAEDYRKRLTDYNSPGTFDWNGQKIKSDDYESPVRHAISLAYFDGISTAKKVAKQGLEDLKQGKVYAIGAERGDPKAYYEKMLDVANSIKSKKEIKFTQGQLYAIDIPDDALPKMLDFDKEMSKQTPFVKEALKSSGLLKEYTENRSDLSSPMNTRGSTARGEFFYNFLSWKLGSDQAASEKLRSLGIPGMRYLDQGSRTKGRGTHNTVIWDQSLLDKISENVRTFYQSSQTDTAAFKKWFGDSKVVDENGEPLVVYHGTTGDFTSFDREKANPESDFGAGFYFTNTQEDVGENYAGLGPDLTNKIEQAAERIASETDREYNDPEVRAEARAKFMQHEGMTIPVYLKMENPAIVGGPDETFLDYEQEVDEEGDPTGDETGKMVDVLMALQNLESEYSDFNYGNLVDDLDFYDGMALSDFVEKAKKSKGLVYATDENGALASSEIIRRALEDAGFDGIIDNTVDVKFGSQKRIGKPMAGMNYDTVHYIVFNSEQIKSAIGNRGTFDPNNPNILEQGDKRGSIQIGDQQFRINLFEKADLSTALHEFGHLFLEQMRDDVAYLGTQTEPANELQAKLLEDGQTILKWLGVESFDDIKTEHHEKFAESFEDYLMEGKAPSSTLQEVFARFRAWLVSVYRALTRQNVRLTPAVRGVMDRLIATDDAIAAAEGQQAYAPIFTTAESAGFSPQEWKTYKNIATRAHQEHVDDLTYKAMAVLKKEREAFWKEERAKMVEAVTAEVNAMPLYRVHAFLKNGTLADGSPLPDGVQAQKLNRQALADAYGPDILKRLRGLYANDGISPELVAQLSGYETGDALVEALVNAPPKRQVIETEADTRMRAKHGDMMLDGSLADEALKSVHTEARAKVLAAELKALNRRRREVSPEVKAALKTAEQNRAAARETNERTLPDRDELEAIKTAARNIVGSKRVGQINPNLYRTAEAKAARKAFEAAGKGKFDEAYTEKRRQILNHELFREAVRARAEIDKIVTNQRRYDRKVTREKIAAAKGQYLAQIDALRERFDFSNVSNIEAARRDSLAKWVEAERAAGREVLVPDELLDEAKRTPYKALLFAELQGLDEAIRNIEHLAKTKDKMLKNRKAAEWQDVKAELSERAESTRKKSLAPPVSRFERSAVQRMTTAAREFADAALRPETIIEYLDGGESGPWHDYFMEVANNAEYEREQLRQSIIIPMRELADKMTRKRRAELHDRITIKSLGKEWDRRTLISIALNMGNESNMERLLTGGYRDGATVQKFTPAALEEIKNALNAEDWAFVQKSWDIVDSLWPKYKAFQESMGGLVAEKIEPVPLATKFGTMRGGYWPAVYDPYASSFGDKQESEADPIKYLLGHGVAATKRSSMKERTAVAGPLLLDYETVFGRHIEQVITDITHREFVQQANRILEDRDLRLMIQDNVGDIAWHSLRGMVMNTVRPNGGYNDAAGTRIQKLSKSLLSNFAVSALGFKAMTAVGNLVLAPIQASARVSPKYIATGIGKFYRNPVQMAEFIQKSSPMMENRYQNIDNSYNVVADKLRGERGFRQKVMLAAMSVHRASDYLAVNAIWLGRYQQALDSGEAHDEAVRLADIAVRQTQTAGAPKDLSSFERDPRWAWFKMFMGPMVIMGNRIRDAVERKGTVSTWPEAFGVLMATWFLPSIMWEFVTKGLPGDDDDDEEWIDDVASAAARAAIFYPAQTLPFIRDAASFIERQTAGRYAQARMSPIGEATNIAYQSGKKAWDTYADWQDGEDFAADDATKALLRASGPLFGMPSNQLDITGSFLWDVYTGEYEPDSAADLRYLVMRREK